MQTEFKFVRLYVLLLAMISTGAAIAQTSDSAAAAINNVLDAFHDAAANGDKSRYLNLMTADAVFLGTDETERWPKQPDFTDYVDARFKDGRGWHYESVARNLHIAADTETAWFDEVVYSETSGRFRGTGVLVRQQGEWKIAQYAFSFLIDNEHWEEVISVTRQ